MQCHFHQCIADVLKLISPTILHPVGDSRMASFLLPLPSLSHTNSSRYLKMEVCSVLFCFTSGKPLTWSLISHWWQDMDWVSNRTQPDRTLLSFHNLKSYIPILCICDCTGTPRFKNSAILVYMVLNGKGFLAGCGLHGYSIVFSL